MLSGIERDARTIDQESLPVGILLAQLRDQLWTSPAAGLIHVPGHLRHHDLAELAGLDEVVRAPVFLGASTLCADLHDPPGLLDRRADGLGVGHGICERLLDVGVAAGGHRLDAMHRMLKVGGRNDHRIDVVTLVQLIVVSAEGGLPTRQFLDKRGPLFAAAAPDVGNGDDLEIQFGRVSHERWDQVVPGPIGEPHDADTNAVVRAADSCLRGGGVCEGQAGSAGTSDPDEFPSRAVRSGH